MPAEESERPGPLAGLVSNAAEELFTRLVATGAVPIGSGPGEVALGHPAVEELLRLGVAFRTGEDDNLLRPMTQAGALRVLLERRQRELSHLQRRILDGWARLTAQLPATIGGGVSAAAQGGGVQGVQVLDNLAEIATVAAELWGSTTQRFRGTETGDFPTRPSPNRAFMPRPGVRYQMIYQSDYHTTPWGNEIIEGSVAAGEEAKLRHHVPVKMFHVDNSIAIVGVDRAATVALLVRAPDVLAMLAEWFDAMWDHPTSITVGTEQTHELTEVRRQVLGLMYFGHSDETIARQLNLSVRTVRRHVNALYQQLNVASRFAAGVAAAKRGWL